MINPFDHLKDLKCVSCIHNEICMKNLGGADLDLAASDCVHFKEAVELPKKFWILFDVPGFYDITEYDVERVLYTKGKIEKMWGESRHSKDVAFAADFGRTVFFSREAARNALSALIESRRGEVNGEM